VKRFDEQYISGWHDLSDPEVFRLLKLAREDLNKAVQNRRKVQQRYPGMIERIINISDRH
jgi:hypothetical protein